MKQISRFSKKQLILTVLIMSMTSLAHAESYTSSVTSGEAWNQAWSPTVPTPIQRDASNETYTFVGDSSYTGKTTLINTTTNNVKVVADSGSLTFNNWNVGSANYIITGWEVTLGDNITFTNTTGNVIRASGSSGSGGADLFTVGSNLTIDGVYSNTPSTNYGGAIYIFGSNTLGAGVATFGDNLTIKNVVFEDTGAAPFKGGGQ